MNAGKTSQIRVLTRPQSSPTLNSSLPTKAPPIPAPINPEAQQVAARPSFPDKVVVVGFIGRRSDDVTQLMNRLLDANVFGSGRVERSLLDGDEVSEELRRWLKWHRIGYYHEEERGILLLQFASVEWSEMVEAEKDFELAVEDWELGNLQGMLLMFSVCHVIVYIEEGSRFNTQVLKKLRVLQAAKHALTPYMRSQTMPSVAGMPHSASFSHPPESVSSTKSPSPGRSGGGLRRNASSFSGVSGLGTYTSMFPGNCTPVTLFVFLDDFSDMMSSSSNSEDHNDKSFVQNANASNLAKPQGLPVKGSGSFVVLSRPANKSEQSPQKKLQSSLEAQIRFLVKKSKLQVGSERSRAAPRSGASVSFTPLLSLDTSKAVILVDKLSNQKGQSLEFACSLVGEILNGKATSDVLLLESHVQMANQDDVNSLKEFILRQCDIFRGRGGSVSSGVGMIAAAVAAATASASSGKSITIPELPNLKTWLSNSQLIFRGLLSHGLGLVGSETYLRKPHEKPILSKVNDQRSIEAVDSAVSLLESGRGLNSKFSNLWCQRMLSAARDVYLKDLPSCYPTGQHEAHLRKALSAFHSMVKGSAVRSFSEKLEEECILIWKNGRQLCDAVSLTGKPCLHQRHDASADISPSSVTISSHSSGFVFLHACACGRSRFLRPDPFDFETANSSSLCPSECGKLLHALQLPRISSGGNSKSAAWSLIRIGAASYYDPAKGLLQSGFCTVQKFLLSWIIFLEKPNFSKMAQTMTDSTVDLKVNGTSDVETKKNAVVQLYQRDKPVGVVNQRTSFNNDNGHGKITNFVRELPNSTIRKPFSEVVAGSAASDLDFPPLKQSKQVLLGTDKGLEQSDVGSRSAVKLLSDSASQNSQKNMDSFRQKNNIGSSINDKNNWPLLQIGNNVIPTNVNGSENTQASASSKRVIVYVGFEYECPYGHRFISSPEHLSELGLLYPASEESLPSYGIRKVNQRFSDTENVAKSGSPSKTHQHLYGTSSTMHKGRRNGKTKEKNPFKSRERMLNGESQSDHLVHVTLTGKEHNFPQRGMPPHPKFVKNIAETPQSVSLDDSGSAVSLLNRNLPIYMKCPHCKSSKHKKDELSVKFASTTSQLQRIFMVTPPLPVILATCPIVQFETSCLPLSIPIREGNLQFSLGCDVILPPESFVVLRLPFIYGVKMEDGRWHPLTPSENQPELTAFIMKGTALRVVSEGCSHSG
uniref:Nonsense-mediated mRNA decay factor SMG8 n=1 Tax=Kalanchoe fedtschenkoi TaxID=63787 RepID=A0A7N0TMQ5_KALFE